MKILLTPVLCLLFHLSSGQGILATEVDLSFDSITLGDALYEIEKVAGCTFAYSADILPLQHQLSIRTSGKSLSEVLKKVLGPGYAFKESGSQIVIYRDEKGLRGKRVTLSGYVKDGASGEVLPGASLQISGQGNGMTSNAYGFYSISLYPGLYTIYCTFVGYQKSVVTIELSESIELDIELNAREFTLNEVLITSDSEDPRQTGLSKQTLVANQIKSLPVVGGEADVIKSIQLLSGVKTLGEGSSGFFVRGGAMDQNLILLDEAPVYNPAHLLGFFSTFNPDALKTISLYSSSFPASYGGRLSSVLDIRMKDGDMQAWNVSGGIGLISSRLVVEGPLKKEKVSLMLAIRRSYADLLLPLLDDPELSDTKLNFYDLNIKANWIVNRVNRLFLSIFSGDDVFKEKEVFSIGWGNRTATLRWNHIFSEKVFANVSAIYSNFHYRSQIEGQNNPSSIATSLIRDYNLKADVVAFPNPSNTIGFGLNTVFHQFSPSEFGDTSSETLSLNRRNAIEHGVYAFHTIRVCNSWTVEYGMRYSHLQNMGKAIVYNFGPDHTVVDTVHYGPGDIYGNQGGIEPRLSVTYDQSKYRVAFSYDRMRQYVHLMSNYAATFAAPEVWLPSNPNIRHQVADQFSIHLSRKLEMNGHSFSLSADAYYKQMHGVIDYVDHAQLAMNPHIDGEVRAGTGKAYGAELALKKTSGRLTGWLNYSYSRTSRSIAGINGGKTYSARYDKPHGASVVTTWKATDRWTIAANWVIASGDLMTIPVGNFQFNGRTLPIYSARNAYRLPTYHRLDLSATLHCKPKADRKIAGSWTFGFYNAYFRKNTFSINYNRLVNEFGDIVESPMDGMPSLFDTRKATTKTYLFGIVPSVTYNFKF